MNSVIEPIQQFWLAFQHGQLPDIGGWNYMLMALFILVQGRSAVVVSGIAAATGSLDFWLVIVVAILARIGTDLVWYRLGATGYINRLASHIGFVDRFVSRVQEGVNDRPQRVILLTKLTNGLATPAVVAAGSTGVPYRRWLPAAFAGELLWILPLTAIGFLALGAIAQWQGGLPVMMGGVTAASLGFILLKTGWNRYKAARQAV
jgi:membrane protein DedA with SNARE-associated domain